MTKHLFIIGAGASASITEGHPTDHIMGLGKADSGLPVGSQLIKDIIEYKHKALCGYIACVTSLITKLPAINIYWELMYYLTDLLFCSEDSKKKLRTIVNSVNSIKLLENEKIRQAVSNIEQSIESEEYGHNSYVSIHDVCLLALLKVYLAVKKPALVPYSGYIVLSDATSIRPGIVYLQQDYDQNVDSNVVHIRFLNDLKKEQIIKIVKNIDEKTFVLQGESSQVVLSGGTNNLTLKTIQVMLNKLSNKQCILLGLYTKPDWRDLIKLGCFDEVLPALDCFIRELNTKLSTYFLLFKTKHKYFFAGTISIINYIGNINLFFESMHDFILSDKVGLNEISVLENWKVYFKNLYLASAILEKHNPPSIDYFMQNFELFSNYEELRNAPNIGANLPIDTKYAVFRLSIVIIGFYIHKFAIRCKIRCISRKIACFRQLLS